MSALPERAAAGLTAATEWRLLALLLSRPRPGWHEEVAALAVDGDQGLRRAAAAAAGAGEGPYHALLGAGGVASPREAAQGGFTDPGRILADLAAFYGAFGFQPDGQEPDDHLAVECDFVAYLHIKEAYALAGGQGAAGEVTREARRRFLREHLAASGRRLAARLPPDAPAYLRCAAEALASRLPAAPPAPAAGCPSVDPLDGGCPMAGDCGLPAGGLEG